MRSRVITLWLVLPLLGACNSTPAREDVVEGQKVAPSAVVAQTVNQDPDRFRPPIPRSDSFDWIRLKSGEWLKGEIKAMRKESLEFDSDELDMLNLDWDDVVEVHAPREVMVLLPGRKVVKGKSLLVRDGVVVLSAAEGGEDRRLDRRRVIGLVPGTESESDYWSGKIALGLVARSGNTDSTDYSTHVFTRRESAVTRWDTTYDGAYSKTSGVSTVDNSRIKSQYDVFLSERLYLTPLGLTWTQDRFQNIYSRSTPYTGLGYEVFERWKMEWDITAAVGLQRTEFYSAPAAEEKIDDTASLILGSRYSWDLTPDIEFDFDYDLSMPMPETQDYNHRATFRFEVDLTGDLDIDIAFIWDRFNSPATTAAGVTPGKDDFRMTIGVGYEF